MYSQIKIELEGFESFDYEGNLNEENFMSNLNKVNVFIGANNSGKSRLNREFFSTDIKFRLKNKRYNEIFKLLNECKQIDLDNVVPNITKHRRYRDLFENIEKFSFSYKVETTEFNQAISSVLDLVGLRGSKEISLIKSKLYYIQDILNTEYEKDYIVIKNKNYQNIYIPILRGLRPISLKTTSDLNTNFKEIPDLYLTKTIDDYFNESKIVNLKDNIFTGLGLYEQTMKLLLGNTEEREKIKKFEEFLSTTFFNGQRFNIVPKYKEHVVYIKIGDEEDKPIHKLGDGIQAIIILTYPLFFNQGKNMVFHIEEPEMHLHPGFQRLFIETLLREQFNTFQYFITTHSNHILDMTLDHDKISVYHFNKIDEKKFNVQNVANGERNVLESIGVQNSSVFLSNCTIWVEGITDRLYIRKFLEIYQKDKKLTFLEDFHFSFLEYGGGNITHWSFLEDEENINVERLCSRLFLVADSDGNKPKKDGSKSEKTLRLEKIKDKLGEENIFISNGKEIENSLEPSVIEKVIISYEGSEKAIEFSKLHNKDYNDINLGEFIDKNIKLLDDSNGNLKRTYKKENTISDKVNFCRKACENIHSIDDLSKDNIDLCEKIIKFIKQNNK
jgi:AAA15 family ATPase/GTPase